MPKKIALIGGGTGGHITPIVALTRYIKSSNNNAEFIWIGEADSMEERFAKEESIRFESISGYRIPSMRSLKMIPALFRLIKGIFEAQKILKQFSPDVLFSKGGPGAISVVLAAKFLNIPVYLHDSDIIPGVSNRFVARFADLIFLGCEEAKPYFSKTETEVVGQLLDPSLANPIDTPEMVHFSSPSSLLSPHPNPLPEGEGINKTSIPPSPSGRGAGGEGFEWLIRGELGEMMINKTRVLIICGSQWSRAVYLELLSKLDELQDFEFIIALGTQNSELAERFAKFQNVRALPWIAKENLALLYREADIIVSRGSITTLAEAAAFGAKIIAIPLPIAAFDHQRANVRAYEKLWYVIGLEEKELGKLGDIIRDNAGRRAFSQPSYDVLEGVKKVAERLL